MDVRRNNITQFHLVISRNTCNPRFLEYHDCRLRFCYFALDITMLNSCDTFKMCYRNLRVHANTVRLEIVKQTCTCAKAQEVLLNENVFV